MAKKPKGPQAAKPRSTPKGRSGRMLALTIFGIVALAVLLVAVSTFFVTSTQGKSSVDRAITAELDATQSVQRALQQQRYQRLNLISRIFATDELLTDYLTEAAQERDEAAILASIEEYQNLLTFDLAVVLDRSGVVLTRTDGRPGGADLSATPLVAVALEESKASGVWQQDDQLYHAVAVPLVRQFELVGYIVVAYAINNALATQVKHTGGAETVYLADSSTGAAVAAATLAEDATRQMLQDLRRRGGVLDDVIRQKQIRESIELEIGGERWTASLAPLQDASGGSVGAAAVLTSVGDKRAGYDAIRFLLLGATAAALIAGLVLAGLVGTMAHQPLARLAEAATAAAAGHLEQPMPDVSGDAGRVGKALDHLLGQAREKQAAQFVAGRVARLLPEPAPGSAMVKPHAEKVALVAVDMPRYADPKIGYDPDENLRRFSRDLQRISTSAGARKGRVASVLGHRVLVLFDGEQAAPRALAAATEMLLTLSERETVFDEPTPPTVAMTSGPAAVGTVTGGDSPSLTVAGVPVQQLDSLLREATPGAIYFPKQVYAELAPLFQRAQVQVKGQRGILSPHPIYLVAGDDAARATGAKALSEGAESMGDGRSLADLRPGVLLGSRFDLVAELGTGRMGVVWKAQDRELHDYVTLKMLRPEVVQDTVQFERLKRVVARSRSIRDANVLGVLDFGETERIPYISMEFVRAMTLTFLLEQAKQVPLVAGIRMVRQIAWGLAAAHHQQVLHGGLKPENILVEGDGGIKVMDFGLGMPVTPGATVTGPGFLAPEQLEGREPDSRADFYAFGAVAYRMFTGQAPYPGGSVDEVRRALLDQQVAPPTSVVADMPPKLEQILLRCLAKQPDERYASIDDLLADLEAVRV
ncbi:MAG: protein kinase [Acidobacteriota bacterium]